MDLGKFFGGIGQFIGGIFGGNDDQQKKKNPQQATFSAPKPVTSQPTQPSSLPSSISPIGQSSNQNTSSNNNLFKSPLNISNNNANQNQKTLSMPSPTASDYTDDLNKNTNINNGLFGIGGDDSTTQINKRNTAAGNFMKQHMVNGQWDNPNAKTAFDQFQQQTQQQGKDTTNGLETAINIEGIPRVPLAASSNLGAAATTQLGNTVNLIAKTAGNDVSGVFGNKNANANVANDFQDYLNNTGKTWGRALNSSLQGNLSDDTKGLVKGVITPFADTAQTAGNLFTSPLRGFQPAQSDTQQGQEQLQLSNAQQIADNVKSGKISQAEGQAQLDANHGNGIVSGIGVYNVDNNGNLTTKDAGTLDREGIGHGISDVANISQILLPEVSTPARVVLAGLATGGNALETGNIDPTSAAVNLGLSLLPTGAGNATKDAATEAEVAAREDEGRLLEAATRDGTDALQRATPNATTDTEATLKAPTTPTAPDLQPIGGNDTSKLGQHGSSLQPANTGDTLHFIDAGGGNTPAYQRIIPQTAGEAESQYRLTGHVNTPDNVFNADANSTALTPTDPYDVPAFMRRDAPAKINELQSQINDIDSQLSDIQGINDSRDAASFSAKQNIADAYKQSPEAGEAAKQLYTASSTNPQFWQKLNLLNDHLTQQRADLSQQLSAYQDSLKSQQAIDGATTTSGDGVTTSSDAPQQTTPDATQTPSSATSTSQPSTVTAPAQTSTNSSLNVSPTPQSTAVNKPVPDTLTAADITPEQSSAGADVATNGTQSAQAAKNVQDAISQYVGVNTTRNTRAPLSLDALSKNAEAHVNSFSSDNDLLNAYSAGAGSSAFGKSLSPQEFANNVAVMNRLHGMRVSNPDIVNDQRFIDAVGNINDNLSHTTSGGGIALRQARDMFDNLPTEAKAQSAVDKAINANNQKIAKTAQKFSPVKLSDIASTPEGKADVQGIYDSVENASNAITARNNFYNTVDSMREKGSITSDDVDNLVKSANDSRNLALQAASNAPNKIAAKEYTNIANQIGKSLSNFFKVGAKNDAVQLQRSLTGVSQGIDRLNYAMNSDTSWRIANMVGKYSDSPFGKLTRASNSIADFQKTAMLSNPMSRVRDVAQTGIQRGLMAMAQKPSLLIGQAINKLSGGKTNLLQLSNKEVKGLGKSNTIGSAFAQNKDVLSGISTNSLPENLSDASKIHALDRMGNSNKRGLWSRITAYGTDLAPALNNGMVDNDLNRYIAQEARAKGLTGKAAQDYSALRKLSASNDSDLMDKATGNFKKANFMDRNGVSNFLNEAKAKATKLPGGAIAANQVTPFGQVTGSMIHQGVTDFNPLYNAYDITKSARAGNLQGAVDSTGKLMRNGAILGLGALGGSQLAKSGVISDKDQNGNKYDGVYLNVGGRSIPLSWGGPAGAVIGAGLAGANNLFGGKNKISSSDILNLALQATGGNSIVGDNPVVTEAGKLMNGEESVPDAASNIGTNVVSQAIPGLAKFGNNVYYQATNQLGPNTQVKHLNPATGKQTKDTLMSDVAKLGASIPGINQMMPKGDKAGNDMVDAFTQGVHANDASRAILNQKAEQGSNLSGATATTDDKGQTTVTASGKAGSNGRGNWYTLNKTYGKDANGKLDKSNVTGQKISRTDGQTPAYSGKVPDGISDSEINMLSMTSKEQEKDKENNKYDAVVNAAQAKYDALTRTGADQKQLKSAKNDVIIAGVNKDTSTPYDIQQAYENSPANGGVSVTRWRDMMNSGDPDQVKEAQALAAYDEARAEAGVSKGSLGTDSLKYTEKGSGRSGSGSGSSSSKTKEISTDISFIKGSPSSSKSSDSSTSSSSLPTAPTLSPISGSGQSSNYSKRKISIMKGHM